jgi:hypothetical protein
VNPKDIFCPNIACPARSQIGKGNTGVHSQKDQRLLQVITLLAYGSPIQAIVHAFGLDERTGNNEQASIAAGLADHIWTPAELFNSRIPPTRWQPPSQRGRRALATQNLTRKWCS